MGIQMAHLAVIARKKLSGITYDLKALFTAGDQTFDPAEVLSTPAQGVQTGSLTVVDTGAGTVKIDTNRLELVGSGTWDQTGVRETTGTTKALGKAAIITLPHNTSAASIFGFNTAAGIARATGLDFEFSAADNLTVTPLGASATRLVVGVVVDGTSYSLMLVSGGFNAAGKPYVIGDTKADFTYGMWYFIKGGIYTTWTLVWVSPTDNTATLYQHVQALEASAVYPDTFLIPTAVLDPDVIQKLWFFDTFTGTNNDQLVSAHTPEVMAGAAGTGNPWESGGTTWTIQGNAASNNPGLEASLWDADAAVFTSGTYSWVAYGANTLANIGNELEITYVNSANGAYVQLRSIFDLASDLIVGKLYKFSIAAYYTGGSVGPDIYITDPTTGFYTTDLTGSKTTYTVFISAKSATQATITASHLGASNVVYLDDLSLQEITLNELFVTDDLSITEGLFDVNVTIPAVTNGMAGLVLALDDKDTPANFIQVYYNRGTGKVEVWKCVAGTYTNLINTTATYGDGYQLRAIVDYVSATDDLKLKVYYNNVLIDAEQTIEDNGIAGGTRYGTMSTDSANTLDNFTVTKRTDAARDAEITTKTGSIY